MILDANVFKLNETKIILCLLFVVFFCFFFLFVSFRAILMRGFDLDASDTKESKDSISSVSSGSLKDWNIRGRDTTVCALQHPRDYYSVWVSYCEIYNEQAFDLLDGCDKKKKRIALRITEDRKGKFFVKGMKFKKILKAPV